jgi:hypothetical protein
VGLIVDEQVTTETNHQGETVGTTEYTVVNHMEQDYCLHKVGCRDITRAERQGLVNQTYNITVTDGDDLVRAVDLDLFACGISSDHGMTPEEYADAGNSFGARVFPCTKEVK